MTCSCQTVFVICVKPLILAGFNFMSNELPAMIQSIDQHAPAAAPAKDGAQWQDGTYNNQYPAFFNGIHGSTEIIQPTESTGTKEKERIAERLAGFNPKDNSVWHEITQRFGASIKQPELLSIANVLAQNANIKLDRDAKRRKSVLIKWFEENWSSIRPFLDYVVLEDSHQ